MFFFPVGCLLFALFLFALPILFLLGFFHVVTFSFESLGISSELTFFLLLSILIGSSINIPLTKKKKFYRKQNLWDLFERPRLRMEGVAINLGGALIPMAMSGYLLTKVPLYPTIIAGLVMIVVSKFFATVSKRGVTLPLFIPPVFSALLALLLAPQAAPAVAFIVGVLGTLIGADLLNLNKARQQGGMIYIGGGGVFDGIFLVGIVAVALTSL